MANTLSTTTVMSTTMVMTSHSMMGNITLPGSDNETIADTKEDYSPIFSSKFVGSLYILIGCMGITGNLLVVYVFANAPSLRKNLINMYIINQSCIDATVSVFLIAISRLTSDVPYSGMAGVLYCRIWQSRFHVWGLLTSSTYNLIALTLERYTEIVYPIWHKIHFSRNKAIISMVCIWLFGLTWEGAGKITPTHIVDGKCSLYTKWPNQIARKILGFNVVIIKLIIPLVVMVFAYSKIAWVLQKKLSENITYNQSTKANGKEHRLAKGKKNTIKTLFIVTVAFFLCWSWNQVYFLMFNLGYPADFTSDFYHFSVLLCFLNCSINPFIYAIKYQQFQTAVKKLFCRPGWLINRVDTQMDASGTQTETVSSVGNAGNT